MHVQAFDQYRRPMFDQYGQPVLIPAPQPVQAPQQRGVGAMPPPPPPPQQQVVAPVNELVNTIKGMVSSVDAIKSVLGVGLPEEEEEEPNSMIPGAPPAPESPLVTTSLGLSPDSPVMVTRKKDGTIDWASTALGNAGQLPKLLHGVANGLAQINQQTNRINQQRPITAQGVAMPMPQHHRLLPEQPVQHQQPPVPQQQQFAPPPPPPPPPPPQRSSFVPSVNSLRGDGT
jgi:hypothetical protein